MQGRNRDTDVENKRMDTKGGKRPAGGGGGGAMNWEIGIDMYTLMCIKWMTNKNLLYKIINEILKFKKINEGFLRKFLKKERSLKCKKRTPIFCGSHRAFFRAKQNEN